MDWDKDRTSEKGWPWPAGCETGVTRVLRQRWRSDVALTR